MSDFEQMREKHRKDSMTSLSFFLALLFVFALHTQYAAAIQDILYSPEASTEDVLKSWLVLLPDGKETRLRGKP